MADIPDPVEMLSVTFAQEQRAPQPAAFDGNLMTDPGTWRKQDGGAAPMLETSVALSELAEAANRLAKSVMVQADAMERRGDQIDLLLGQIRSMTARSASS